MTTTFAANRAGDLLRDWRQRRRRSQMDLAHAVGVSPRHLSFVETGRSKPSPELLMALAEGLEVPLRERNAFLLAAGYAPRYRHTPLDDPAMARVRASLQRLLDSHDPYPGVVIDRLWNVVLTNAAAGRLAAALPSELMGPPLNVFRACLHPEGFARQTLNLPEWSAYLLGQLRRLELLADPEVSALAAEVASYPLVADEAAAGHDVATTPDEPALLVPWRLRLASADASFFTTLTAFGTPQDITLAELAVELFYPADDETEALLRAARS
jgi:transcriptional regulator with XRE-family HTH domain